jgi:hypothetical protein
MTRSSGRMAAAADPGHKLTCEYHPGSLATHLLVADLHTGRAMHLVCRPCGLGALDRFRAVGARASLIALAAAAAGEDHHHA